MENTDALQAIERGEKPDQETLLKLKDEGLVDIANVTHMQSPGQEFIFVGFTAKGLRLLKESKLPLLSDLEREITKAVVRTFLDQHGAATSIRTLLRKFKLPITSTLQRLGNLSVLMVVNNAYETYLPRASAFYYCGDSAALAFARKSTEIVLRLLRDLFDKELESDTKEQKRFTREEVENAARAIDSSIEPSMIFTGLYLAQEFSVFSGSQRDDQQVGIVSLSLNDRIYDTDSTDCDQHIRRSTRSLVYDWEQNRPGLPTAIPLPPEHFNLEFYASQRDSNNRKVFPKHQGVEVEVEEISTSKQRQDGGADADRKFARLAIEEARKSVPENDGRLHPWVGAVVVKDGKVLGTAHRGEVPGNHAEFVALEKNLPDVAVAGATVYTTLEPCTTRNRPKIPCADRLIERRVARVVIGILDPDDRIRGKGQRKLSNAGIETSLFPHDLAMEVEELNREFTRFCEQHTRNLSLPTTDEDRSSWPDVILECQWPSLVHESRIPGSHTVRKRPWMLRYRGPGAVYNVRVHDIDFGAYKASFPFPVPTLTDTASVHPIICQKSDGLVITTHDLESLMHNPPSGCDLQKYAVKTDGNEGEEIQLERFILEVEIPVTISYDDKNGNRFKIRYLLGYDIYMEKGEMIRIGGIERVAPK